MKSNLLDLAVSVSLTIGLVTLEIPLQKNIHNQFSYTHNT
jgi:hypothetical protein